MGTQLLFLRCYPRINDNSGLANTACQEGRGPRALCFLLSFDLLFSLHLGPGLSDMPAHSRGAFPPCTGPEQVEFIKHCPGDLLEDAEHPHAAQGHVYCVLCWKDSQSQSATGQWCCCSILLLRYPVAQDNVSPDSKCGKTATDHLLESPTLRCSGDWPWSSLWSTCQEAAGQSSSN